MDALIRTFEKCGFVVKCSDEECATFASIMGVDVPFRIDEYITEKRRKGDAVTASAAAVPGIETTQDIGIYFNGYGFDTDLASAAVDKVKIPKKWDDSFAAFNQIVQESGLDLADYKGKTVEKWTVLCPQLSTGEHDTYCVLLVYKAKAVGAYLLQKPSGEVTGLVTAAKAGAEAAAQEEDTVEISADAFPQD